MTAHATRLLRTFDWHSISEFMLSMAPSFKYNLNVKLMIIAFIWVAVDKGLGLDDTAFIGLLLAFVTELVSGIAASRVRKEAFSSLKLSRFSVKVACYLSMIGISYAFAQNFKHRNDDVAFWVFDWLHIFLIVQIVFEHIVSILENIGVITGKDKTHWIIKITQKLNSLFS